MLIHGPLLDMKVGNCNLLLQALINPYLVTKGKCVIGITQNTIVITSGGGDGVSTS
jgi:hypothetical protein